MTLTLTHQIKYVPAEMELDRIVDFILGAYWGSQLSRPEIVEAFAKSYCVGLFSSDVQLGFARAVSDGYTGAYIKDFFVFEEHQGTGHGIRLWQALEGHPELTGVRRWHLGTKDAHGFYQKCGFQRSPDGIYMNLRRR